MTLRSVAGFVFLAVLVLAGISRTQEEDFSAQAQAYRKNKEPVAPLSETTILAEAEEFQVAGKGGWQAKPFGTNYFAATFANSFLSRKAYLGAPEQCAKSTASLEVEVPKAGKYLALVRYESCYRFETQFRLRIEQNGKTVLDRLYGARDNLKIWAFHQKLKKEIAWDWGAVENIVWEGHDAAVTLNPGRAKLTLIADKQTEPAARRNVDCVLLTSDEKDVHIRIEKEQYLPLDGLLTQAGDVFVKVHNTGGESVTVTFPNGTEHSPYWIHMRTWKPKAVKVEPGKASDWVEVGSLLDTLSDGQWNISATGKGGYSLEFALKNAAGKIEPFRKLDSLSGNVVLAYDGDTRYSRRIRLADDILYNLVAYLKKHPVKGTPPKRTLIYGSTFSPKPADAKYTAALNEFIQMIGAPGLGQDGPENLKSAGLIRGYIDVRDVTTDKLADYCKKLQTQGKADKIAVVSLGDEIGLAAPPAKDHAGFRAWLKTQGIKPGEVDPAAGNDYDKINFNPAAEIAKSNPRLYYYSKIYGYRYGIKQLKDRTDILRKYLPNAGIGANFSPHHKHMYLGDTHHWISVFREDGMTMPWGEDYIWQVPVGTQQMNFIMLDMFRAAIKNKPQGKIHYYVMPHTPGNTPANWRRQFYGDLAHGAKVLNLFEFRPVQHAYTENHCNSPAMYQEVRKSLHELGKFEDIIQDGQVRPAQVGLWCSETADVWDNHRHPFDAAKRCLYIMIRHLQAPLDFVVDGDDLKSYKVLFLCDANVSRAGSQAIADWVKAGGHLVATAGAGMFDEFNQPNKILRGLLGVNQIRLDEAKEPIRFEKQDLPFATRLDQTKSWSPFLTLPIYGARSVVTADKKTRVDREFKGGEPAFTTKKHGKGEVCYLAFLPGLSYFAPALPRRPMDRGATDQFMSHFLPTDFDRRFFNLSLIFVGLSRFVPIHCSNRDLVENTLIQDLVETTLIQAKQGVVIPLINWSAEPVKNLEVIVWIPVPRRDVSLASGGKVQMKAGKGFTVFTLDLDVADALILR